jgi:hypothetical protein
MTAYHTLHIPVSHITMALAAWQQKPVADLSESESQETEPESQNDTYLRCRSIKGLPEALLLFVQLPALPRGVDVELQPMCALHPGTDLLETDDSGVCASGFCLKETCVHVCAVFVFMVLSEHRH